MSDVQWLTKEEERTWRGFQFVQLRLGALLAQHMGEVTDISYTDYMILVALTDQPESSMRLFEMSRALGWEKSRLSHHVGRMVERGLVTRSECPEDRRGTRVAITPHGMSQLREEAPYHVATVRRLFIDKLTPQQKEALAALSETVLPGLV
jgi:DNA-binding MarR family transcriptional regulator